MNIGIYGIGNFGFALLKHLDKNRRDGLALHVSDYDTRVYASLLKTRKHPRLFPSVRVSDHVVVHSSLQSLIATCNVLVLAVNSDATRDVVAQIRQYQQVPLTIVNTAKALDYASGRPLSELIQEELGKGLAHYAVLAGGTIARDLFAHEPLGVSLACADTAVRRQLVKCFESPELFVYPSSDVVGVECAGAFKNVIAILAGITKGIGFSLGSETHVISRAADEAASLAYVHFGAKKATFSMKSQCWGNDLWMSCLGETRNRAFGVRVGQLGSFSKAHAEFERKGVTVEGASTIKILHTLGDLHKYPVFLSTKQLWQGELPFTEFKRVLFSNLASS